MADDLAPIPDQITVSFLPNSSNLSQKSLERGLNYYVQGYIHDVKIFNEKNGVQVAAKCWRSMRKSEKPHQLNLTLSTDSITDSFCSCTAG